MATVVTANEEVDPVFKSVNEFVQFILEGIEECVDFDFFAIKRSNNEVLQIAEALKQGKALTYVYIRPHTLTKEQQHILLSALLSNPTVEDIEMIGFDFTSDHIAMMSDHPRLERLQIYGLEACSSINDEMLKPLGMVKNLIRLYLRYAIKGGLSSLQQGVSQAEPALMKAHYQVSIRTLLGILKGKSPLIEFELSDCRLRVEDSKEIEDALMSHQSLECVRLPAVLQFSRENKDALLCDGIMLRNLNKRCPSDKIRYVVNSRVQRVMSMSQSLTDKMFNILKTQSGRTLRESLQAINFDPLAMMWDQPRNPILNSLIANEALVEALHFIEEFPELLPSQRDIQRKTALLTSARVFSADNVMRALLKRFNKQELDIDAQDENGCTALHYLCAYGKTSVVNELLKLKPNVLIKDRNGRTTLDYTKLDSEELGWMHELIHVRPSRDSNAVQNALERHIRHFFDLDFDFDHFKANAKEKFQSITWLIANTENLQALMAYGRSPAFLEKYSQQDQRRFMQACQDLQATFSGKSVLQFCLENREYCEKVLLDYIQNNDQKEQYNMKEKYDMKEQRDVQHSDFLGFSGNPRSPKDPQNKNSEEMEKYLVRI